jgi:hypothetical protein
MESPLQLLIRMPDRQRPVDTLAFRY